MLYVFLFYHFFVSPTGFRWRALYGDEVYPEGYEIHGIDISHYQGKIDWEQLNNAMIKGCPVRFVIIKSTEGSSRLDENFRENFNQARDYGFIRGVYHFWSNKSTAREQAYYFLEQVHLTMVIFRPYSISSISPMIRVLRIFSVMCSRGCIS